MFLPFGFLAWIFPKFYDFKTLILSFLFVLIIVEALQYFTRLGVFDIDDIILNSIGMSLGFLLMNFLERIFVVKH
ncbi:VanZ family protein, partial [Soonwooa sp.]